MVIFGPFIFNHVKDFRVKHVQTALKQPQERGVDRSDFTKMDGTTINMRAHLYYLESEYMPLGGSFVMRNLSYHALRQAQLYSKKNPLPLVSTDPFEIWQEVVLEDYTVDLDSDIKYGPNARAWFVVSLVFRVQDVIGGLIERTLQDLISNLLQQGGTQTPAPTSVTGPGPRAGGLTPE